MVAGFKTACHRKARSIQQPFNQLSYMCIFQRTMPQLALHATTKSTCRELFETTVERIWVQGTRPHRGNPAYLGKVEIWGFRPAAITSRLSIACSSTRWTRAVAALSEQPLTRRLSWSQWSRIRAACARPAHSKTLQRWRLHRIQPMQQASVWNRWATISGRL